MAFTFNQSAPREVTEAGVHDAVCIGVWDLGTHPVPPQFGKGSSHRIALVFELRSGVVEFKEYSLNIYKNPKTGVKTALATDLESWFFPNSVFNEKGESRFGAENLVRLPGKHCQLKIGHNARGYAKVESVHPPQDKTWEPHLAVSLYEVGVGDFPPLMPKYMIAKIATCEELAGGQATSGQENQERPAGPTGEVPF